ncbi:hypothetical protein [Caulobacter mirabilis]|uniref:Uncharacterized protein n=1 Tax=Caulobacter mirabilis TaxID=69666 RepID=A0A2D2AYZ0_9CAUL|nr:hypothetical protein [Caulobacter mirabilis]ATQ43230.1 hypothetical protein CSW64_12790 [Caulobacter mirabilis]
MSTFLTINVTNNTSSRQDFYFFQQPAVLTGGSQVYSNSLYTHPLQPYQASGMVLTFQVSQQPYAAIQQAADWPQVGRPSGFAMAARPIDLTPPSGSANDWTTASVQPLGLSQPMPGRGQRPGSFRITIPSYQPTQIYNIGQAVQVQNAPILSSFIIANPNTNTDCMPAAKFYVQAGAFTPGTIINFPSSSVDAAFCDFTGGARMINVTHNPDGTWTVRQA